MGLGPGSLPPPPVLPSTMPRHGMHIAKDDPERFEWNYDACSLLYLRVDRRLNTVTRFIIERGPSRIPKVKRKEHRHGSYHTH
jgi:hypothetical protein